MADQCSEQVRVSTANSQVLSREGHIRNDNTLKTLMKKGLLPEEKARTVDMDRLEEEAEDFTTADWNRLAIHPRKLQPLSVGRKGLVLRTIVGERQTFAQGKKLNEKKTIDGRVSTSQSIQQNNNNGRQRRTARKPSVSPDKMPEIYQQKMGELRNYDKTMTMDSKDIGSPSPHKNPDGTFSRVVTLRNEPAQ